MQNPIADLTRINLDDLVAAFGFQDQPISACLVRFLFREAARKFARQMLEFDSHIMTCGLAKAAQQTEKLYVKDLCIYGREHIPNGPFLALSNHPGMTDTLAVIAALGAADLKVIALNRPFLLSLPNLSRRLFFVTEDPNERVTMVRQVSKHLRMGGATLTFPAGHNEPDPDVYPGAVESLQSWTESTGVFLRLAPETAILPVVVRNVIWEKIAHHPVVRIKKNRDERELLAVALQLLLQVMFNLKPVTVKVQIGKPITVKGLGSTDANVIHRAVLAEMKGLIENPPEGSGENA